MAKYKFYNIGQANSHIETLEAEIAALKAAPKQDESSLTAALASNEEASAKITSLTAENESLTAKVNELSALKPQAESVAAIEKALNEVCTRLNMSAEGTHVERIANIEKAVVKAVASVGIDPKTVPAAGEKGASNEYVPKAKITNFKSK